MNLLTDQLPTAVLINDVETLIDTDFRAALSVVMAFEDNELTHVEKQQVLLNLIYSVEMPADLEEACKVAIKFLNGGKPSEEGEGGAGLRLYSFSKDASFIFSAFKQTHGIDLTEIKYLHWWKFLALFMDLGPDTTFCNLVSLRKRIKTGQATKEERAVAREMGDTMDLPEIDTRSVQEKEKESEFLRMVEEGNRARKGK